MARHATNVTSSSSWSSRPAPDTLISSTGVMKRAVSCERTCCTIFVNKTKHTLNSILFRNFFFHLMLRYLNVNQSNRTLTLSTVKAP
jgi:hypothetical protein